VKSNIPSIYAKLAIVVIAAAWQACVFTASLDTENYPECGPNGECNTGCSCFQGRICVPDAPGHGPDFCAEQPECTTDEECGPHCDCVSDVCEPPAETSYPDYCLNGPPECEHDFQCLFGCHCDNFECLPIATNQPAGYCLGMQVFCTEDDECRLGCQCESGQCLPYGTPNQPDYCNRGLAPTCMPPDLIVTTNADTLDPNDGELTLREALVEAAAQPGPHRIAFADEPDYEYYFVDGGNGPLPPIPSLTYLDGGEGVALQAIASSVETGLTIDGNGIAVSDIEVYGFEGSGVKIVGGASDVHLFRMRIGRPIGILQNGRGIEILPDASRIHIGRGRELECVEHRHLAIGANPAREDYDINVITSNNGEGIVADTVENLFISATWVGFNNLLEDWGHGDTRWGNLGVGILLHNVNHAVIGARQVDESESIFGENDPLPGFVGVGRNHGGGVRIQGGGNIFMPGLMLGDTPIMNPYGENHGFNLEIIDTEGPVYYGPSPFVDGPGALHFGLIYSENVVPIRIINNWGEVWIRSIQNECLSGICPPVGVEIVEPRALIRLHHMTFLFDFLNVAVVINGLVEGGEVELINNLFIGDQDLGKPVVEANNLEPGKLVIFNNMKFRYGEWCIGQCEEQDVGDNIDAGETFTCEWKQAVPTTPTCENVDVGAVIYVDAIITEMNLTGVTGKPHHGCAPDIGFIECYSPACLAECE
jgi:hypothetical protein